MGTTGPAWLETTTQAGSAPPGPAPRVPDEGDWRSGGYRSGGDRAKVAQVLYGIGALATIALAVVRTQGFELLDRAERLVWEEQAWLDWEESLESVSSLDQLVWQVAGISFIVWLSRYVDNVPALGGGMPKRSPARVIVYWIVPIINFIFLPLILRDAGRRMAAARGDHGGLLVVWWLSWVAAYVIIGIEAFMLAEGGGLDLQRQLLALDILFDVTFLVQAVLAIVLIRRMQADEDHHAAQLRSHPPALPSPSAPPPPPPPWPGDAQQTRP
jgi:hypothetical protein